MPAAPLKSSQRCIMLPSHPQVAGETEVKARAKASLLPSHLNASLHPFHPVVASAGGGRDGGEGPDQAAVHDQQPAARGHHPILPAHTGKLPCYVHGFSSCWTAAQGVGADHASNALLDLLPPLAAASNGCRREARSSGWRCSVFLTCCHRDAAKGFAEEEHDAVQSAGQRAANRESRHGAEGGAQLPLRRHRPVGAGSCGIGRGAIA